MNTKEHLDLTPIQRRRYILELLHSHHSVEVKELADQLRVNAATVRRDLNALALSGEVSRTHGGAVLVEGLDAEIPLSARESLDNDKKDYICRIAAEMVHDGDTVIMDSSSTTARMIKFLSHRRNLKIITNGAKTAVLLTKLSGATVYCTGGKMRENSLSYIGQTATDYLRNFHADILFFSCRGLTSGGLYDASEDEALLRRVMMEQSSRSVLLVDSTKLNTEAFVNICPIDKVDRIICDTPLPF